MSDMPEAGRRPKQYSQTHRVFELLHRLQARRSLTQRESLAEDLGVTDRQLRRDLAVLEETGYDLEQGSIEGRAAVRLLSAPLTAIPLTRRERYTLVAARRLFEVLRGTPFHEDMESVFHKVAATLSVADQAQLGHDRQRFLYLPSGGQKDYHSRDDLVDALLTGVLRRQPVACRYRPPGGRELSGTLEAYSVVVYRQGLYVVGRLVRKADPEPSIKVYAVERFSRPERLRGQAFEVPADYCVDNYFAGAFGIFMGGEAQPVVLRFQPRVVALAMARDWHASQRFRRQPDGTADLHLTVPLTPELVQWVVGWGPTIQVIAPDALRQQVHREHQQAAAQYGSAEGT